MPELSACRHRLLDIAEVTRLTTLRKSALYELIKAGELKPIKLGRRTAFLEADIADFIDRKIAEARQPVNA